jgi:hypothetical protein
MLIGYLSRLQNKIAAGCGVKTLEPCGEKGYFALLSQRTYEFPK